MSTSPNRRAGERQERRLRVRFLKSGAKKAHAGFTTNLSSKGAYVSTHFPIGRGERLRLEVVNEGRTLVMEAVVAHAHRVPPELRKIATSGMGVRFLSRKELMASLMPATTPGGTGSEEMVSPEVGGATVYPVHFASLEELARVFRRDLVNGGLFVITDQPSQLTERVVLELFVPTAEGLRFKVPGRVVQVVEPGPEEGGATGGMGIEILDVESLVRKLRPVLDGPS